MISREPIPYVGRFAPSPTGPLHFGSLVAAAASYLQALQRNGRWLLRIEDIDPPREQPGADALILKALERYGFEWDGPATYQSQSNQLHLQALQELQLGGLTYNCGCSRKDLREAPNGPLGIIYPGTCRNGSDAREFSVRVRVDDTVISFEDGLQGQIQQDLKSESGDFIVLRRDGLIAYHLAVVVDDHAQGVTEIVRGIDLLDSTPRQIFLQQALGYSTPAYLHIPVVINADEQKLSKLTGATGIPLDAPKATLVEALTALQLPATPDLDGLGLPDLWKWAVQNWDIGRLTGRKTIASTQSSLA